MKNFFKFIFSKKFLFNFLAAIVLFFVLCYTTLVMIDKYTSHGISVQVPELSNMSTEEANALLNKSELQIEVIDSIFTLDKNPGIIMEQNPPPLSTIKKGRKVYVVINAKTKKKTAFPEVKDYSPLRARTILEGMDLIVDSIEYIPSEFEDVKYAKVNGNIIDTGAELTVGTNIVLVVGAGLSDEKIHLPSFRGLTLEEAKAKHFDIFINLGSVQYDEKPINQDDIKNYVIYKQSPIAGSTINLGKYIDVWLTKDKSRLTEEIEEILISDDYDIENFFTE